MKQKNVVLMVVAVGCGLVAAFLTAQMSAKPIDQLEVVVAARDLPVGTMLKKEDLQSSVKIVKRPKDGLPPTVVLNPEELVDKRLSRPVRAEEVLNSQDLSKGGIVTLPDGYDMMSFSVSAAQAAAGFVGPGSRVDVLATLRQDNKYEAFPLLVNMLVVAVGTETAYSKDGTFPNVNMVSFAVKEKEALLLQLARTRGCSIELLLRHPGKNTERDKNFNIDEVIKKLSTNAKVSGAVDVTPKKDGGEPAKPEPKPELKPAEPVPAPSIPMVKVLVAKKDIAPNTEITKDLIANEFEEVVRPKEYAGDAMGDLTEALGKFLKTGVSKDQPVTPNMVGLQSSKVAPPREFYQPLPAAEPKTAPVAPAKEPVAKRKTVDVAVHTTAGTVIHRYEEVAPGQWKKVAEMTPERAARSGEGPEAPEAPKPERKAD